MAKATTQYTCQSCGSKFPRWSGKCEQCGTWNSLVEEAVSSVPAGFGGRKEVGRHHS